MSLRCSTTLTEDAYLAANRLHLIAAWRSKQTLYGVALLSAFFMFLMLVDMSVLPDAPAIYRWLSTAIASIIAAIVAMLLFFAIGYLLIPRRSRSLFDQQKTLHGDVRYEFNDTELHYSGEYSSGKLPFAWAHKWVENREMLLIYNSSQSFFVFSKSSVVPEIIEALKARLIDAGRPGRKL